MGDAIIEGTRTAYTHRTQYNYSGDERRIIVNNKNIILLEMENSRLKEKAKYFENQVEIAHNVVGAFTNRKIINIMVVCKTQSGKTGSMCTTIEKYLEDEINLIPIENIYIITGLSSCEWKKQTKERMPGSIQKNIYHRGELLNKFVDDIRDKKNVLIIMDEVQVAAQKDQTIYSTFQNAGLLDKNLLYQNDIKILEYTATPDGTIYDLMKWADASRKILVEPGHGYIGSYDLYQKGRVKQFKDLCGYNKHTKEVDVSIIENIREIKADIDTYATPRYHIIRTGVGAKQDITIANMERIFKKETYEYINYDRDGIQNINGSYDNKNTDINTILRTPPKRHTFIIIKDMLRCAKTIDKKYIGILYDRFTSHPDDAVIIQGLIGRNTGYDVNRDSIVYTHMDSITKYEDLWKSHFENKNIKWNSKTTTIIKGILSGKNTFNDPKDYSGFSVSSDESTEEKVPTVKSFKEQSEIKKYYEKFLKGKYGKTGPRERKPNSDGFYEAVIRSKRKVYSYDEIYNERKSGLTQDNYRVYPCYDDINDKETLKWCIIHYEKQETPTI